MIALTAAGRTVSFDRSAKACSTPPSTWGIEVGILAHLDVGFVPLLFEVHQDAALAEFLPFDLLLRGPEGSGVSVERAR